MKLKRGGIKQKSTAWNNHQLPALEHPALPKSTLDWRGGIVDIFELVFGITSTRGWGARG